LRVDCVNASKLLTEAVAAEISLRGCECIIMSGGIDTSYIAAVVRLVVKAPLRGVVVGLEGSVATDLYWGSAVARTLGIDLHHRVYSVGEALRATDHIVYLLDTFDPIEVRNDVSVYIALAEAKKMGCSCVYTGDAGDELFAGYSYMHLYRLEELSSYIRDLAGYMEFSSDKIGRELGIDVSMPLASKSVVELAIEIPPECKVPLCSPARGKGVLRSVLEDLSIPSFSRVKQPIERGSGSVMLSNIWSTLATDEMVRTVSRVIQPRSRDQAYLLSRYLDLLGEPRRTDAPDACRICGGRVKRGYCKRCGYYSKQAVPNL